MKKRRYLIALLLVPLFLACRIFTPAVGGPALPTLMPSPSPTPTALPATEEPASQVQGDTPVGDDDNIFEFEWIVFVDDPIFTDLAVSADGDVYLITSREKDKDCYLSKTDGNGGTEWRVLIATFEDGDCGKIIFDQSGNIYISGVDPIALGSSDAPVGEGYFIAKFDVNGTSLQNYFFEKYYDRNDFDIDSQGNIYLSGDASSGKGFSVSKINPDGNIEWEQTYPTQWVYYPSSLRVIEGGDVFVYGLLYYRESGEGEEDRDCFLSLIASDDGTMKWDMTVGAVDNKDEWCNRMEVDAEGNAYVSGYSGATWGAPLQPLDYIGEFNYPFIAKFSANGDLVWNTFPMLYPEFFAIGTDETLISLGFSGSIARMNSDGSGLKEYYFQTADNDSLPYYPIDLKVDNRQNVYVFGRADNAILDTSATVINPPAADWGDDENRYFIAKIILDGGAYRPGGPLVPEIARYIPTPRDVETDPLAVWVNLFLAVTAATLMLPFALVVDAFSGTLKSLFERVGEFTALIAANLRKLAPVSLTRTQAFLLDVLREMAGIFRLFLAILFYAVVFSLLDPSWDPFSLKGLILLIEMAIAFGVVGILDDMIQWIVIRSWGIPGAFKIRAVNALMALASVGISRIIPVLPGLMFGSPEALIVDEKQLNRKQNDTLTRITLFTFAGICFITWVPTLFLELIIQQAGLAETPKNIVAGVEGFLLILFAVALENVFVQLVGVSDGVGKKIRRQNFWGWFLLWIPVAFIFLHTLLNPRNSFLQDLQNGNPGVFIAVTVFFMMAALIFIGAIRLIFWALKRK
jgi:outer membrane protein assembly factor BamB